MKKFLSVCLLGISLAHAADSPVQLQIERSAQKANIGLSDFTGKNTEIPFLSGLKQVINDDLVFSTLFNVVSTGPQIKRRSDAAEWAAIGSEVVLGGEIRSKSDGRVSLSMTLYDVKSAQEVLEIERQGTRGDLRWLGHEVSNEIVRYFTGQPGLFHSKIAFVNDATGRKELYCIDYDGKNAKRLTNDNAIVTLPRFSPDRKKIIFTSYLSGQPYLYLINADGTGRKKLSSRAGLNVSPSWDPNGEEFAITLSHNGPPNIYLMDMEGKILRPLTDSNGADTAPTFSPDGSQIAFTSDRSGSPHIYVMNADGTGLRRLTTVGHCDSAAWSPDGQTLVYVKGEPRATFDIYSIEVMTGIERRLTWGQGDNENPAWSPDSRFIVFTSSRRGKSELYIMSADGSEQRPLFSNQGASFTPHWSL